MRNIKLIFFFLLLAGCGIPFLKPPAAVTTKKLDRPGFEMNYSSNWNIDSLDEDFDIDHCFTLNGPDENGFIMFFVFNTVIDEKTNRDNQIDAQLSKTIKNGKVNYFETWAGIKGQGATINGRILGIMKGEIKIFAHSCDTCAFVLVSQLFDGDKDRYVPGFNLIESSFKIKKGFEATNDSLTD